MRAEQAAQRKDFVKTQVDVVEANLREAEKEVSEYKAGNALTALSDEAELLLEPWTQNEIELARTQSALGEAKALLDRLRRADPSDSEPLMVMPVGLPVTSSVTSLIAKLAELEVTRKQLLPGRRPDHPARSRAG